MSESTSNSTPKEVSQPSESGDSTRPKGTQSLLPINHSGLQRWPLALPIIGGVLILLIAVTLVAFLGLRGILFKGKANPGIPLQVTKLSPTVAASPLPPVSCETIISSGDVEVAVPLPISLTVKSQAFPIVPIVPEEGKAIYPAGQSGIASWLCGSVVNYVVGLEPTPGNETLLTDLRPGDEVQLQLSNGVTLFFRFAEQREVTAGEADIFKQQRPRLSLILDKDGTWQVALADYVAETEPVEPPTSGTAVQPGQPVRTGDARVTVIEGRVQRGSDLPAGTMYYLVEFSLENVGDTPLEAEAFAMTLKDGMGNSYLLSPAASETGEHGPLAGKIEPGTTVQGTAGYLVPDPLAGPLTWTFNPQPGSDLRASVNIPYTPEEESADQPSERADVTITDAFLNNSGDTLIIEGKIQNIGDGPLTVENGDISLSSSAGIGNLRMAAPPLPWTVDPGKSQVIELQYEKPDASAVLLEILGYSFEIEGL